MKYCKRCGGRMLRERTPIGDEWGCLACGHVEYTDRESRTVEQEREAGVPRSRSRKQYLAS